MRMLLHLFSGGLGNFSFVTSWILLYIIKNIQIWFNLNCKTQYPKIEKNMQVALTLDLTLIC